MSRLGITYDDVLKAATSIEGKGETPTIEKIREFLGSTGSNTTISKYLQRWRNQFFHGVPAENNNPTPDIVKIAVERVWQDMRQETDNEIERIKTEAQNLIEESLNKTHIAETNFNELKLKHDQLVESYQAERAEKELLLLDMKKFREEHTLLKERFKALETRYAEMQTLTSQHLTDLSNAHKNEVGRLEEAVRLQLETHTKLVNTIKDHSEQARHQHIVAIDSLKVENKKLNEHMDKLQSQLQDKFSHTKKLESEVKVLTVERDEALNRLNQQDKKWSYFTNKLVISDDVINKIYDTPTFDKLIDKFSIMVEGSLDNKFMEMMKENVKLFDYSKLVIEGKKDK